MDNFIDQLPKLPNSDEMRQWDKAAIDFGIPEIMLMENAGRKACDFVKQKFGGVKGKKILIFMGAGNNGGDAASMARHLADMRAFPYVFHIKPVHEYTGAAAWHAKLAQDNGAFFIPINSKPQSSELELLESFIAAAGTVPDLIIDGLLGIGFVNELRPYLHEVVKGINNLSACLRCPVISLDIPSGLNANTGLPSPLAVKATVTVTFGAAKPGLILPYAKAWTGQIYVLKIGYPVAIQQDCPASARLLDGVCLKMQPDFPPDSYKNVYGHVVVIGGKGGFSGAAHLAAAAAIRMGAGLVTACAPATSLRQIKSGWPEIMTHAEGDGPQWPDTPSEGLIALLQKASALIIGPGFGRDEDSAKFLDALLNIPNRPAAVFDADALILLSKSPELLNKLTDRDIMTPHPGEAGALLDCKASEIQEHRENALQKLCDLSAAVVVLKGAATLTSQKGCPTLLCPYDLPQLAIGGAGDVLSGCIATLLGSRQYYDHSTLAIAGLGVATHAMSALYCVRQYPYRGLKASELADALCKAREFVADMENNPDGVIPWPA